MEQDSSLNETVKNMDNQIIHPGYDIEQVCIVYSSYQDSLVGLLSTYADYPVKLNNKSYLTAEHAIQAERMLRFNRTEEAKILTAKPTPHQCRRRGDKVYEKEFTPAEKELWEHKISIEVICKVLTARAEQNIEIQNCLRSIKGYKLIALQTDSDRTHIEAIAHQFLATQL